MGGWGMMVSLATPPFTPKDIPSLLASFDSAAVLDKADGDFVPVWGDTSGNGFAAVVDSGNAVYHTAGVNGQPALRFGEFGFTGLKFNHSNTVGDRTMFQIIKTAGSPFGSYHTTQLQEYDPYMQTYGPGSGTIQTYTNPNLNSGVVWSGAAQAITLWCEASTATQGLRVDGTEVTSGWTPGATSAPWFIGGFQPGGYAMNGWIGEILIYERCLTLVEREKVQTYLKAKWSLP